jgi:hypothetical protein
MPLPPPLLRFLTPLWTVLRKFWFCWVITVISLVVKENYPFSNNPMYARWEDETYTLHTTNEQDQILFFDNQFGQTAIRLKKMVKARLSRMKTDPAMKNLPAEEQYRIAGVEALKHFHDRRWVKVPPALEYKTIKLWRTDLKLETGKVSQSAHFVAEYTPGGAS